LPQRPLPRLLAIWDRSLARRASRLDPVVALRSE